MANDTLANDAVRGQLADAYAFLGNSLLKPMTQTADVGLDPAFWEAFPAFGSSDVAAAVASCARYAERARREAASEGADPVERCAVEYTRLFIGPPSPAAAPWETMYRGSGLSELAADGGRNAGAGAAPNGEPGACSELGVDVDARSGDGQPGGRRRRGRNAGPVGFGQATFEMRELLRENCLELRNENNQYEDHMGIELLLLSEFVRRGDLDAADAFARDHPLDWVGRFRSAVTEAFPGGYFDNLLGVVAALLAWQVR